MDRELERWRGRGDGGRNMDGGREGQRGIKRWVKGWKNE